MYLFNINIMLLTYSLVTSLTFLLVLESKHGRVTWCLLLSCCCYCCCCCYLFWTVMCRYLTCQKGATLVHYWYRCIIKRNSLTRSEWVYRPSRWLVDSNPESVGFCGTTFQHRPTSRWFVPSWPHSSRQIWCSSGIKVPMSKVTEGKVISRRTLTRQKSSWELLH